MQVVRPNSDLMFYLLGLVLVYILGFIGGLYFGKQEKSSQKPQDYPFKSDDSYKMVLVIRTDLGMTKGKVAAQCCHACLGAYEESLNTRRRWAVEWQENSSAKITLKCPSEEMMVSLQHAARKVGLVAHCIRDAGRTQIPPNTRTVLAIGPGPVDLINQVTGELSLY